MLHTSILVSTGNKIMSRMGNMDFVLLRRQNFVEFKSCET